MRRVRVIEIGTYEVVTTIELTDEQWENGYDPESGKFFDVDMIAEEIVNQDKGGHTICAQCSGWERKFSLTLYDETDVVTVIDVDDERVLYDKNR